jgi:hypothetical protein
MYVLLVKSKMPIYVPCIKRRVQLPGGNIFDDTCPHSKIQCANADSTYIFSMTWERLSFE